MWKMTAITSVVGSYHVILREREQSMIVIDFRLYWFALQSERYGGHIVKCQKSIFSVISKYHFGLSNGHFTHR